MNDDPNKTKTGLPSLKPKVDRVLFIDVVYKNSCPHSKIIQIGYTCRHLKNRIGEYLQKISNQEDLKNIEEYDYENPDNNDFKFLKI